MQWLQLEACNVQSMMMIKCVEINASHQHIFPPSMFPQWCLLQLFLHRHPDQPLVHLTHHKVICFK